MTYLQGYKHSPKSNELENSSFCRCAKDVAKWKGHIIQSNNEGLIYGNELKIIMTMKIEKLCIS